MKTTFFLLPALIMFFASCTSANSVEGVRTPAIIPSPSAITVNKGEFTITGKSVIVVPSDDPAIRLSAELLAGLIKNATGFSPSVTIGSKAKKGSIFMNLSSEINNEEGYLLAVTPKKIEITASTPAGLFYAVQTIRQMLPVTIEKMNTAPAGSLSLQACIISDEPRFKYRGMHLDVARHLFPVETIKSYIDMMALHKMNTFHWHLTDDQGWRIEIKKYPKLTEIGAYRKETVIGHAGRPPLKYDGTPYGGFYTQDQVKEIVAYAKDRFITVIPEIEMPGHAMGALAGYPELSCTGGPFEVNPRWGVMDDVFCAGNDKVFAFLEDVLTEVIALFPGTYIHVGGDECPKTRWEKCPLCQARIKAEGLKDEHELQSYFIRRMEKFLLANNRKLIGWDEILDGGLAPEATVMSWRGIKGGIAAAKQKHDVIMTPNTFAYLDYYQAEPAGEPLSIGGYLPLEKVYSFNPMPEELTPEEQNHILGVQGNLWTEYISTPEHLQYMAYPRALAIAESGWTADNKKDFEEFLVRLEVQKKRYDAMGINYFRGEYRDTRAAAKK